MVDHMTGLRSQRHVERQIVTLLEYLGQIRWAATESEAAFFPHGIRNLDDVDSQDFHTQNFRSLRQFPATGPQSEQPESLSRQLFIDGIGQDLLANAVLSFNHPLGEQKH